MKRYLKLPALLAALALTAAACSSSGGGKATGTTTGGGGGGASLSGVTVNVDAVWSGAEQKAFQAVLKKFEDDTGAKVNYTSTGDDIAAVLGTAIEGGNPPDVAMLPQPGLMKELANKGNLKSIEDAAGSEIDANYNKYWRDFDSVNGTLYGVFFKAANKSLGWYNTSVFDSAGVTPPKTWDDFLKAEQTIADSGTTPLSIGGADGWTLTDWFENVYLQTAGPDMYDKLANHEIPWTDASVKTALTTIADAWKANYVAGGYSGALQVDFPTSVTQVFSSPPKAAMVFEADFVAGNIKSDTKAKLGTDANVFPFPKIGNAPTSVITGGDTAVMLKDSKGAKALIKYLATPEAAEIWAKRGGFLSLNQKVDPSVYPDDITRQIATDLANAEAQRFDMSDLAPPAFGGTAGSGEWKILQDFLNDPTQVDSTAQKLESAAAQAFGG